MNTGKSILGEQLRQLHRLAPLGVVATAVNALILAFILRKITPPVLLYTWFFIILLIASLRHPLIYKKFPFVDLLSDVQGGIRFFVLGAAMSGLAWGSTAILFFPKDSVAHQTFLAFVLGGMVAGAVGVYSVVIRVFLAFSVPAILPLIIRFFIAGDEIHIAMGGMVSLFAVLMLSTARRIHETTITNFKLSFENSDLVDYLSEAKERAENFNRELQVEVNERIKVEKELIEHKDSLAGLVGARTAELEAANQRLHKEIIERKRLEDDLTRTEKLESLGILAGGIAHDFNNLLTGILGNISLAVFHASPESKIYSTLLEAEKASLRARDLTQQLLTFSKGGTPVKETVAINELIMDSMNFALRGSNVGCDFKLKEGLCPVEVDTGQISQVIHNLAINAIQAMPEGGVIQVHSEDVFLERDGKFPLGEGRYALISIADKGSGIPEENLNKVFDPYFSTKENGSGLGLSTTYSIIQKHGGHIAVESMSGEGTVFNIYLPASDRPIHKESKDQGTLPQGHGKILVMDDEEAVADYVTHALIEWGYSVESVLNGEEAIDLYQRARESGEPFDAVIMDLTIQGGMGGREAIRRLLSIDPDARVIVSSGYSNDPLMANYRKHGFRDVIVKPYRHRELAMVLHKVLSK